eukprot:CAMPEP_0171296516 /NCGR_PEP_ID=MMETSP0816-20121228/5185_1 /TAXON_ID=420281 /ORGANISM="Proboscia inermis, Strain CCAP1064/1" /LENGTH=179 /DNA_ID=CAMNT_0011770007 /DNA_START=46 /DNA_END=586 /DNA_ORIENTATION=+
MAPRGNLSRAKKRKANDERGCRDTVKQNFMLAICKEIDKAKKELPPTAKRLPKGFLQGIVEKNQKRGISFVTFTASIVPISVTDIAAANPPNPTATNDIAAANPPNPSATTNIAAVNPPNPPNSAATTDETTTVNTPNPSATTNIDTVNPQNHFNHTAMIVDNIDGESDSDDDDICCDL